MVPGQTSDIASTGAQRLAAFIRARGRDILDDWERAVRRLSDAPALERPVLLDHVPALLSRIADHVEQLSGPLASDRRPRLSLEPAEVHALERLAEGLDLHQVVSEYALLRDCIVRLWSAEVPAGEPDPAGVRALHQVLDGVIAASVQRYAIARDRTLWSLDRVSAAALETRDLDDFLGRWMRVLLETTAAVDVATILLVDGDALRVRASIGQEDEVAAGWSLRVGEGFAGRIAATGRPLEVPSAATDPGVLGPSLRARGVQTLYGTPLIEGGRVLGVAQIGSSTAAAFSSHDRRVFDSLAHRATSAISLHLHREAADRRARQQQAIAALGMRALATRDLDALLPAAVETVTATLGVELAAVMELEPGEALVVRAETGWGLGHAGAVRVPLSGGAHAAYIVETGEPAIIDDLATEARFAIPDAFRERGVRSGIGVPIRIAGERAPVYGVLTAHTARHRAFTTDDVAFFQAVGHIVGSAIALRRAELDRARVLEQEQAQRAELEAVIESIPDPIFIGTEHGFTRVNRAALQIAGWTSDADLRRPIDELLREVESWDPGTGAPLAPEALPLFQALQGRTVTRELVLKHLRTGREIFTRASAAPILLGGRVIAAVVVGTDITEIRRAQVSLEEALAEQQRARAEAERMLAVVDAILAASAVGIGFMDTELRYVRVNAALAALNGLPVEQHIGRSVREVLGDANADLLEPLLRGILATRAPMEREFDGAPPSLPDQVRSFFASYVPVITVRGELLGVGAIVLDVTERKRMERELREREVWFRSLADNIPQLAWMADEAGALFWFNRRWYEFTGTTPEQMQGGGWRSAYHPDHIGRVVEKWLRDAASGDVWEDTFPLRRADGRYRWFLSRAVPIRDEAGRVVRWFGTNTDITEQRLMHEATTALSSLLDHRETLERVAQLAVPGLGDWCAIDLVDETGIMRVAIAHADPAKVELARALAHRYAFDRDAPLGVPRVIRTGATEHVPEVSEELLARCSCDPEYLRIARALGLRSYVTAPLVARNRRLGAITVVSGESGRVYAPADLAAIEELGRRIGLAIDNARLFEEAQREARMREEILAVVSHDLKNPLGAIHLAASLLLEKAEPRISRHLAAIDRAARRMDHLIGDLLDMASVQAGRLAIERRPEDVEAILREAAEANAGMAKEKGLALVLLCEAPGACDVRGASVLADRDRILQVFGNLIGNAIKFGRPGDTITIRGGRRDREVELAVADTGPGISDAELPHIFEPYWSAKKYARKGTGLGLYISKGIVEAHGGRIWGESKLGEGTTFYFTIPLA